jgi:predicted DNA-binding protein
MPIDKNEITKEMIAKAMQCETADELIALANSEGIELTKEEAEAYLAELEDFELDSDVLQKVAGGGVYDTVTTIIKEVPNVVKNI